MDFWISQWISGFQLGFLDFWISVWISADGVRDFFRDGPLDYVEAVCLPVPATVVNKLYLTVLVAPKST